jgi:hypothetical protein
MRFDFISNDDKNTVLIGVEDPLKVRENTTQPICSNLTYAFCRRKRATHGSDYTPLQTKYFIAGGTGGRSWWEIYWTKIEW